VPVPSDLVLLTCKSYDLDAAIASIAPALGERTLVLPLLNGLAHIERLRDAFGAARVLGGTCVIPATLTPEGEVQHLGTPHRITFGPLAGTRAGAAHDLEPLREAFARGPVEAVLADDMAQPPWEKFVGLATLAAMTCLMRAAVGDIVASDDGALLMEDTLRACVATATAAGHAPREAAPAPLRAMLFAPGSDFTASILRDPLTALHARTRRLFVASARHSGSYGWALRLDPACSGAPLGHGRKTLSL
jgi:2-dehydropantoate 2-reductase